MAGTFTKKTSGGSLPPAGSIRFFIANSGPFTFDDAANLNYTAANAVETALLRSQVGY